MTRNRIQDLSISSQALWPLIYATILKLDRLAIPDFCCNKTVSHKRLKLNIGDRIYLGLLTTA